MFADDDIQMLFRNVLKCYSKTLEQRGSEARDEFISRFTDSNSSKKFLDPIHKLPSKTFGEKPKKSKITSIPEDEGQSFSDILSRYHDKVLDLRYIMECPGDNKAIGYLYRRK